MTNNNQILNQLENYRSKRKFSDAEWSKRGLIPTCPDLSKKMELNINQCTDLIIILLKTKPNISRIKNELIRGLNLFNKLEYDTEEKAFIASYFDELSSIVGVDIDMWINSFIYGWFMAIYLRIITFFVNRKKLMEVVHHSCSKCNTNLDFCIIERKKEIPDYGSDIVKCRICGEFNLITIGPEIRRYTVRNYDIVEHLSIKDFNLDQANIRLEQIKHFRK